MRGICRPSRFQSRAAKRARQGLPIPRILWKFEVAREASSRSLCASVRAVLWADGVEQLLSRLAPSGCDLSADVRIFGAGMPEVPGTDPLRYV